MPTPAGPSPPVDENITESARFPWALDREIHHDGELTMEIRLIEVVRGQVRWRTRFRPVMHVHQRAAARQKPQGREVSWVPPSLAMEYLTERWFMALANVVSPRVRRLNSCHPTRVPLISR